MNLDVLKDVPILLNCRDRLGCLAELVTWLERAGHEWIVFVDNDSSYPPLLEYFEQTPHTVLRLNRNIGHNAVWEAGVLDTLDHRGLYVVTDSDVVPDEQCPNDAVGRFADLLLGYSDVDKVGFGLRIDDLPKSYMFREQVILWESQFWEKEVEPGIFDASIDTTFALYRPTVRRPTLRALRTGKPYLARHSPWYSDSAAPSEEERYYRIHVAPGITNWTQDVLSKATSGIVAERRGLLTTRELARAEPLLAAWADEPAPAPETTFMPLASPGWHGWDPMSPGHEFCELARALARLLVPSLVVETGVGQGFVTRRVAAALGPDQRLLSFESDVHLRGLLAKLPFFSLPCREVSRRASPSNDSLAGADLTILDSDPIYRCRELERWAAVACDGAVLLVANCDTAGPLDESGSTVRDKIVNLGLTGTFLGDPRGSFLGIKGQLRAGVDAAMTDLPDASELQAELAALKASRSYRWMEPARRVRHSLLARQVERVVQMLSRADTEDTSSRS